MQTSVEIEIVGILHRIVPCPFKDGDGFLEIARRPLALPVSQGIRQAHVAIGAIRVIGDQPIEQAATPVDLTATKMQGGEIVKEMEIARFLGKCRQHFLDEPNAQRCAKRLAQSPIDRFEAENAYLIEQ